MRIAIFTDTFLPSINGIVTSVVNSSKKMAKKGHKIYIFTSKTKEHKHINLGRNISIEHFKPVNLIRYPDFQLTLPNPKIIRRVRKFRPDIIHTHMPSLLGWEAVLCSKIFDIPLVGTYHTLLPDFLEYLPLPKKINKSRITKAITWNYTRRFYNRCDLVTTPSESMKKELVKHKIRSPVRSISNGVDLNIFYPKRKKKNGKTIVHIGRISYEKNIDIIIKAFKLLVKKKTDSILLIAGRGPDIDKLKKDAGNLLNKNIKFLGPIPHEKLVDIYSSADIFVTASTVETEGLVILEAMACGLPIIGVDKLAIPHIVKHEKNGFIAKVGDEKQIAKYMETLLDDHNLRERMGKESLKIVKIYSLDDIINELEDLYHRLIRK